MVKVIVVAFLLFGAVLVLALIDDPVDGSEHHEMPD